MSDAKVTFTTPGGTQVTCPPDLAAKLGWTPRKEPDSGQKQRDPARERAPRRRRA
nr:MAG TPA: hypothetical protein [Caudoviricetes sp.]DAL65394.1 MAG TPA_asm: hypothetical protein [Caudoviricetes sp.]